MSVGHALNFWTPFFRTFEERERERQLLWIHLSLTSTFTQLQQQERGTKVAIAAPPPLLLSSLPEQLLSLVSRQHHDGDAPNSRAAAPLVSRF